MCVDASRCLFLVCCVSLFHVPVCCHFLTQRFFFLFSVTSFPASQKDQGCFLETDLLLHRFNATRDKIFVKEDEGKLYIKAPASFPALFCIGGICDSGCLMCFFKSTLSSTKASPPALWSDEPQDKLDLNAGLKSGLCLERPAAG